MFEGKIHAVVSVCRQNSCSCKCLRTEFMQLQVLRTEYMQLLEFAGKIQAVVSVAGRIHAVESVCRQNSSSCQCLRTESKQL